jgi:hypothetical protein
MDLSSPRPPPEGRAVKFFIPLIASSHRLLRLTQIFSKISDEICEISVICGGNKKVSGNLSFIKIELNSPGP